jgi:hypothetical protein
VDRVGVARHRGGLAVGLHLEVAGTIGIADLAAQELKGVIADDAAGGGRVASSGVEKREGAAGSRCLRNTAPVHRLHSIGAYE